MSSDEPPCAARRSRRSGPASPRTLLVAAMLVLVLGVASVPLTNLVAYSPGATVASYLRALGEADAGRALGHLQTPSVRSATLTDQTLADAPALPRDVRVLDTEVAEDTATATVRYTLGDSTREITFDLVRAPSTAGLWDAWRIHQDTWPVLDVSVEGSSSVEINGVTVPTGQVPVFVPAGYSLGSSDTWFRADSVQKDLTDPTAQTAVSLTAEPTAALEEEVQRVFDAHLDSCAEQTVLMPTGCLVGYETDNTVLGDVTWTLDEYPDISLETSGDTLRTSPTRVDWTVSMRQRDAVTAHVSDIQETVSLAITATVVVDGDEVRIVPTRAGHNLTASH
ncbi:hypothetical protein [Brevibacterium litoralis]|uniref:hypothetical protein n=1 Tax=Brevibacterium litoralis TaxID=3138935 RepID=UPI0032EDD773